MVEPRNDDELTWALVRCDIHPPATPAPAPAATSAASRSARYGVAAALALAVVAVSAPAAACWDGYLAIHGGVTVQGADARWDRDRAEKLALWLPRIDALLRGGEEIEIYWGEAFLPNGSRVQYPADRFDVLFARVARELGVDRAGRRAAERIETTALTVQIAATRDADRAHALADRLNRYETDAGTHDQHGFYEAGGFPAFNPSVHVITRSDVDGAEIFQVVVGAFLDRSEADGVVAALAEHGMHGAFVRRL